MSAKPKILFMGTPDFACVSLRALVESGADVVGVVTQADKPKGRGYTLTPPPVKVYALEQGLPVYQPATLKAGTEDGDTFAAELSRLAPELIVVVAYGKILPGYVLDFPALGCINVHGSLLPAYRGAAPMQRAIIDGCTVTGITTMHMAAGLDTGDMLLRREVPIGENDNFEDIHDRMADVGAALLLETVDGLVAGTVTPIPQDDARATYAAKIEREDCAINFAHPARELHNRIRGLSPIPLAYTTLPDGKRVKLIVSTVADDAAPHAQPGEILAVDTTGDGWVEIACAAGSLRISRLTPEGKGKMSAADFVRGRKASIGDIWGK
ncbi:MAG: methionyl-tRNA formyltransferase [Clostridia bacterium]|nr:methionyl-tRNA formyltransferase [Clostridia bacterium]